MSNPINNIITIIYETFTFSIMLIELKFLNKKRVKLWEEGKIMGTFASTGAFFTLKSNMGMLNTKKAKMFLININQ